MANIGIDLGTPRMECLSPALHGDGLVAEVKQRADGEIWAQHPPRGGQVSASMPMARARPWATRASAS